MASLTRNGKNYGLVWTVSGEQTRESLQTTNVHEARDIKKALEHAVLINRHDPFKHKWYENDFLRESILTKQYERIYQAGKPSRSPSLEEASRLYIQYKTQTPGEWDSKNTQKNYSQKIKQFIRFTGRQTPVNEITDQHISAFTRREPLSDFTIQSDIRTIKTFLNWCGSRGYRQNEITMTGPTPQKEIPDFIYPDQLKKVCLYKINKEIEAVKYGSYTQEAHSQWWHPLFWILLARTGMRPSELIAVRLPHINGYEILARKGTTGKSQAAKRRIPVVGQEARQCIDVLTDPHVRDKDSLMKDSDYLFGRASQASQKRASGQFSEAVHVMLQNRAFKMRDLRNCWAYWFLTRDASQDRNLLGYKLKRIMGHSTSDMSEYYMDSLPYNPDLDRLHRW